MLSLGSTNAAVGCTRCRTAIREQLRAPTETRIPRGASLRLDGAVRSAQLEKEACVDRRRALMLVPRCEPMERLYVALVVFRIAMKRHC
jgi:hypothetical protein